MILQRRPSAFASAAVDDSSQGARGTQFPDSPGPWSGQEFDLVTYLHTWGENRVYFQRKENEHLVSVPASWTDLVPQGPVVQLAAGRSLFRVPDLLELVQMVEESRHMHVKEITP